MIKKQVLILGAGPAGAAAAEAAAAGGAAVTLCGAEPFPPYWRPRLTRCLSEPAEIGKLLIRKPDWYAERGIRLEAGRTAERVDTVRRIVRFSGGAELPWDALVIAAGASPARPAIAGAEHALTLRGYDDAVAVREAALKAGRAVVVGGGLLGLESAWELNAAGVKATLVERNGWLMPKQLNRAGGEVLRRRLEASGLEVVTARDPSSLGTLYQGACVLLCAGVNANLGFLSGSGVETNRAVAVDDRMMTSVEGVYACGDVAEYRGRSWGLIAVAQEQGKVAGANAAEGGAVYQETPPSPVLKVGAHAVFSVGDVNEGGDVVSLSEEKDGGYACLFIRGGVLAGAVLVGDTSMGMKLKKAVGEKKQIEGFAGYQDVLTMLL